MYLIDCRHCRTRMSDEARICPVCGAITWYERALARECARHERPVVVSGESTWNPEPA